MTASILDNIDTQTNMVGLNRLGLLLFKLDDGKQHFGINVFKVREVLKMPDLNKLPDSHRTICGVMTIRGKTIPVLDLSMAVGREALEANEDRFVIITEYNGFVQGFLVYEVQRIIHINWERVLPPPNEIGPDNYLTAITKLDGGLVEILDVERVLSEVMGEPPNVSEKVIIEARTTLTHKYRVLVADDSVVARRHLKRTLDALGIESTFCRDGLDAFNFLQDLVRTHGGHASNYLDAVISDIEMPEMDGYTLTSEIRKNDNLKDLYVLLHTSLSGDFNKAMVEKVGANAFLSKWHPDKLAHGIVKGLIEVENRREKKKTK